MAGWASIYNQTTSAMANYAQLLARLQEQASTGARVIRASDDPSNAYRILSLRSSETSIVSYKQNLQDVTRNLTDASTAMTGVSGIVARVRTLVTQAASGTYTQANRTTIGHEINNLLDQAVALGNSSSLGRFLFGGTTTGSAPYEAQRVDGRITAVTYKGSQSSMEVSVAPGVKYASSLVGDRIFRNNDRGALEFLGNTGAASGSGTGNIHGDAWLTIEHRTTTLTSTTGIAPGASSDAGDTIIGDHTITVDAAAMTIRLDGGPAVQFTGAESDLKLTNADGDVAYIDVTAWTGASETVDVAATGEMSLDDGLTWTLIDHSTNQAARDSRNNTQIFVDTSGIERTGVEPVRATGTYDLFNTLIGIRDMLMNEKNLPESRQIDLLAHQALSLTEVSDGLTANITAVGGRLQAMDNLKTTLDQLETSSSDQAAMLQDADIIAIATDLARTQTLYQLTMTSAGKLLQMSLLDYI